MVRREKMRMDTRKRHLQTIVVKLNIQNLPLQHSHERVRTISSENVCTLNCMISFENRRPPASHVTPATELRLKTMSVGCSINKVMLTFTQVKLSNVTLTLDGITGHCTVLMQQGSFLSDVCWEMNDIEFFLVLLVKFSNLPTLFTCCSQQKEKLFDIIPQKHLVDQKSYSYDKIIHFIAYSVTHHTHKQ